MKAHFRGEIESLNRSLRALADQALEMVRWATTAAARGDVSFAAAVTDADEDADREGVRI